MRPQLSSLKTFLPQLLIVLIIISEFATKILRHHFKDFLSPSLILKSVFLILISYLIIKTLKDKLTLYLIILLGFLIFEFLILRFEVNIDFYFYGIRYLYFLFFIILLKKYNKSSKQSILIFFDYFLFVNTFLIFIGLIFEVDYFETYRGTRIGFNGLLNMVSDTNYIYALYILINFLYPIVRRNKIIIFINIIIAILVGTKMVVFLSFIFLANSIYKKSSKMFFTIISALLLLIIVFKNAVINSLKVLFKEHLFLYDSEGLLSAISSTRLQNAINSGYKIYNDNTITDTLFYNRKFINLRVEMELFDLVLFWGLMGVIIYIYIFYKSNMTVLTSKKDVYILVLMLSLSFFGGKLLTNFAALLLMYTFFTSKRIAE